MRNSHLSLAVVPATAMGLLGAGAVAFLLTEGASSTLVRPVLIVVTAAAICVLIAGALAADTVTRYAQVVLHSGRWAAHAADDLRRRAGDLTVMVTRGRHDLVELAKDVRAGARPPRRLGDPVPADPPDPILRLAHEVRRTQDEAWNAVLDAAFAAEDADGDGVFDGGVGRAPDQRVEVFVSLARRMQSLSHRAIQGLDDLENQVEDPDLLKGLFRVDHLSTRMRRQAESLAVIGGAVSRRQWSRPVTMYEVLRSAIAEVEQYNRVKVVPPVDGTLNGGAVADIIHLLAELIENATRFAPPQTQVLLRAETVTAGLAIEVEDRGLGIPRDNARRLNALLADYQRDAIDELLRDGRIGLVVVAALARRHNVAVQLQSNVYGGTQAVVVLPRELIGTESPAEPSAERVAPAPLAPEPLPPRPLAAEPLAAAPLTADPVTAEPLAADPLAMEPLAMEPLALGHPATAQPAPGQPATDRPATDRPATGQPVTGDPTAGQAAAHEPETGSETEPAPGVVVAYEPGPDESERPPLPRRRAQESLAPQLRDAPMTWAADDLEPLHDPGLMAAFRRGMRDADADENGGPTPDREELEQDARPMAEDEPGRSVQ